jgi:hypothetical protein
MCHDAPRKKRSDRTGRSARREEAHARVGARMGQPRCRRLAPVDRWLCVPVFRRVCLCHCEGECRRVSIWSQPYGGWNSGVKLSQLRHRGLTADNQAEQYGVKSCRPLRRTYMSRRSFRTAPARHVQLRSSDSRVAARISSDSFSSSTTRASVIAPTIAAYATMAARLRTAHLRSRPGVRRSAHQPQRHIAFSPNGGRRAAISASGQGLRPSSRPCSRWLRKFRSVPRGLRSLTVTPPEQVPEM